MPLFGAVIEELLNGLVVTLLRPPHHLSNLFRGQFGDTKLFHLVLVVEVYLARIVLFQKHLLTLLVCLIFLFSIRQLIFGSLTPYLIEKHRTILSQFFREYRNHFLQFVDIIMDDVIEQLCGLVSTILRQRFVEVIYHRLAEVSPIVLSASDSLTDISQCIIHSDGHTIDEFLLEFRIHARLSSHFRNGSNLTLVVVLDIIDDSLSLSLFLLHFRTERLASSRFLSLAALLGFLIGCIVVEGARSLISDRR